jgi:hypothetical protein
LPKTLKSKHFIKLITLGCALPFTLQAQEGWKVNSAITAMTGHYTDSLTMNNQHGTGIRLTGVRNEQWGITAGLQTTRINLAPITQTSTQNQDNWLLSAHIHLPSNTWPGRWTIQFDTHRIYNDTLVGDSNGVRVIAPQLSWLSHSSPLKIDLGYASSHYKDSTNATQISPGIGFGFNQNQNWFQARAYITRNLEPARSLGQSSTHGSDFKLTQFLPSNSPWMPSSVTLGLERGKKFHVVDMITQTVYNLPMVNEGGANIAATWKVTPSSELSIQASKNRYFADPSPLPSHRFTLSTLSAQLATAW